MARYVIARRNPNAVRGAFRETAMPSVHLVRIVTFAGLASLVACSSGQLPSGATLAIEPSARSFEIVERLDEEGRCRFVDGQHTDLPLLFALRDAQGSPIGDADVSVYADFAANTFAGFPALALYEDRNGNGVVDAETELVSGRADAAVRIDTDRFGGNGTLLLRVNLSCPYKGEVFAFAGGVSAAADIEVTVIETIESEPRDVEEVRS